MCNALERTIFAHAHVEKLVHRYGFLNRGSLFIHLVETFV